MPESGPEPEESHPDSKLFGKHKWRGKIFAPDGKFGKGTKSRESNDEDVAHFLHSNPAKVTSKSQQLALAPRIDTSKASRWPAADEGSELEVKEDRYHRPKPRQNKGLHVVFAVTAPTVIGVGGDEAELPSKDVARSIDEVADATAPRFVPVQRRVTDIDDADLQVRGSVEVDADSVQSPVTETQKSLRSTSPTNHIAVEYSNSKAGDAFTKISRKTSNASSPTHKTERHATWMQYDEPTQNPDSMLRVPSQPPVYASNEGISGSTGSDRVPSRTASVPRKSNEKDHRVTQERALEGPTESRSKPLTLRDAAKSIGLDALDDLDVRVRRLHEMFRLSVTTSQEIMTVSFSKWVHTAAWWFLRGRGDLEQAVRNEKSHMQGAEAAGLQSMSKELRQAYVDLAKAWWIVKEITPRHPEIRKYGDASMSSMVAVIQRFGDATLAGPAQNHVSIIANMRALAMSMKRNTRLPPDDMDLQQLDLGVLIGSPNLSFNLAAVLSASQRELSNDALLSSIPVGDTNRFFVLARMFVQVSLASGSITEEKAFIPCLLSVMREKGAVDLTAILTSQDCNIDLIIQPEHKPAGGLSWRHVHWKASSYALCLDVSDEIQIFGYFSSTDFQSLWDMRDYTMKIQKDFAGRSEEKIVFDCNLFEFDCFESKGRAHSFPSGPVQECHARLFAKTVVMTNSSGHMTKRSAHRFMTTTSPSTKLLKHLSQDYISEEVIVFNRYPREDGPKLTVRVPGFSGMTLSFERWEDLDRYHAVLSETFMSDEDYCPSPLPLQNFNVLALQTEAKTSSVDANTFCRLRWQQIRVVNRGPPSYGHGQLPSAAANNLRMIALCETGAFVDHLNLSNGELYLCLSVENSNEIRILRPPQLDMTLSLQDGWPTQEIIGGVSEALQMIAHSTTIRAYHLRSLKDLHTLQFLITGFKVHYDNIAMSFNISRKRSVVPIHKHWEVNSVRLQIVRQDTVVQLVAFFKDFTYGACMNFVVKVTDTFETYSRSGGFYLRLVDAKYPLPKGEADPSRDFLCLDSPEYPAEHDDITIGFDDETERNNFASQLPAGVNKASRLGSLKR